jgi:hypothetical protein
MVGGCAGWVLARVVTGAVLITTALLSTVLISPQPSGAIDPTVAATFTPRSIEVASGRSRAVVLQVSNNGSNALSH